MNYENVLNWFLHGGFLSVVIYIIVGLFLRIYKSDQRSHKNATKDVDRRLTEHIEYNERTITDLKTAFRDERKTDTAMILDQIKGVRSDLSNLTATLLSRHK